jgi:hypothetical protein
MKFKDLLIKLGEQTEEKINQIRDLQKKMHEYLKDRTPEEMADINNDPDLKKMGQKLNNLMEQLW